MDNPMMPQGSSGLGNTGTYKPVTPELARQLRRKNTTKLLVGAAAVLLLFFIGGFASGIFIIRSTTQEPPGLDQCSTGQYSRDLPDNLGHVTLDSAERGPVDDDGAQTLVLTFTITNTSGTSKYPHEFQPTMSQKGTYFGSARFEEEDNESERQSDSASDDIMKPGEIRQVTVAVKYLYPDEPVVFRQWSRANITDEWVLCPA